MEQWTLGNEFLSLSWLLCQCLDASCPWDCRDLELRPIAKGSVWGDCRAQKF